MYAILVCVFSESAAAQDLSVGDQAVLAQANALVEKNDVCKSDEWGYLCNQDSWTGAADAVTDGKELQTVRYAERSTTRLRTPHALRATLNVLGAKPSLTRSFSTYRK